MKADEIAKLPTPIRDKSRGVGRWINCVDESVVERLEQDRAALIGALQDLIDFPRDQYLDEARETLAAVKERE